MSTIPEHLRYTTEHEWDAICERVCVHPEAHTDAQPSGSWRASRCSKSVTVSVNLRGRIYVN